MSDNADQTRNGDWGEDFLNSASSKSQAPSRDWVDELLSTPPIPEPSFWDKAKQALFGPGTTAGVVAQAGREAQASGEPVPVYRDPLRFATTEEEASGPFPDVTTFQKFHEVASAPPVKPSVFVPSKYPRTKASFEVGESFASPENVAIMEATGGLGTAIRAFRFGNKKKGPAQ